MLVVHENGNINGDSANGNYNYFLSQSAISNGVTAHAFLDSNQLLLTVPKDQKAYHVRGSYQGQSFNDQSYGMELCNLKSQEEVEEQFANATKYYAILCIEFNLNPYNDIRSHNELTQQGNVKGGHVDPDAYLAKWGYDMDMFRDEVAKQMSSSSW